MVESDESNVWAKLMGADAKGVLLGPPPGVVVGDAAADHNNNSTNNIHHTTSTILNRGYSAGTMDHNAVTGGVSSGMTQVSSGMTQVSTQVGTMDHTRLGGTGLSSMGTMDHTRIYNHDRNQIYNSGSYGVTGLTGLGGAASTGGLTGLGASTLVVGGGMPTLYPGYNPTSNSAGGMYSSYPYDTTSVHQHSVHHQQVNNNSHHPTTSATENHSTSTSGGHHQSSAHHEDTTQLLQQHHQDTTSLQDDNTMMHETTTQSGTMHETVSQQQKPFQFTGSFTTNGGGFSNNVKNEMNSSGTVLNANAQSFTLDTRPAFWDTNFNSYDQQSDQQTSILPPNSQHSNSFNTQILSLSTNNNGGTSYAKFLPSNGVTSYSSGTLGTSGLTSGTLSGNITNNNSASNYGLNNSSFGYDSTSSFGYDSTTFGSRFNITGMLSNGGNSGGNSGANGTHNNGTHNINGTGTLQNVDSSTTNNMMNGNTSNNTSSNNSDNSVTMSGMQNSHNNSGAMQNSNNNNSGAMQNSNNNNSGSGPGSSNTGNTIMQSSSNTTSGGMQSGSATTNLYGESSNTTNNNGLHGSSNSTTTTALYGNSDNNTTSIYGFHTGGMNSYHGSSHVGGHNSSSGYGSSNTTNSLLRNGSSGHYYGGGTTINGGHFSSNNANQFSFPSSFGSSVAGSSAVGSSAAHVNRTQYNSPMMQYSEDSVNLMFHQLLQAYSRLHNIPVISAPSLAPPALNKDSVKDKNYGKNDDETEETKEDPLKKDSNNAALNNGKTTTKKNLLAFYCTESNVGGSPPQNFKILQKRDFDILWDALISLYDDRIFPGEKILKARLQQQGGGETLLESFLSLYDLLPGYKVVYKTNKEKSDREDATLEEREDGAYVVFERGPEGFLGWVDPNSSEDPYPPELWSNFTQYLETLLTGTADQFLKQNFSEDGTSIRKVEGKGFSKAEGKEEMNGNDADEKDGGGKTDSAKTNAKNVNHTGSTTNLNVSHPIHNTRNHNSYKGIRDLAFHRGRYGMALCLCQRNLPFLRGYTIGEICHVIELGIQKKLLAYENSMLLPVSACNSFRNALVGAPNFNARIGRYYNYNNYRQDRDRHDQYYPSSRGDRHDRHHQGDRHDRHHQGDSRHDRDGGNDRYGVDRYRGYQDWTNNSSDFSSSRRNDYQSVTTKNDYYNKTSNNSYEMHSYGNGKNSRIGSNSGTVDYEERKDYSKDHMIVSPLPSKSTTPPDNNTASKSTTPPDNNTVSTTKNPSRSNTIINTMISGTVVSTVTQTLGSTLGSGSPLNELNSWNTEALSFDDRIPTKPSSTGTTGVASFGAPLGGTTGSLGAAVNYSSAYNGNKNMSGNNIITGVNGSPVGGTILGATGAYTGSPTTTTMTGAYSNNIDADAMEPYVRSLEELRRYIEILLQAYPSGFNLSVVKIKIRTIFHKLLSETVFHQTKLLDLMRSPELKEICRITKLNKGYWVEGLKNGEGGSNSGSNDSQRDKNSPQQSSMGGSEKSRLLSSENCRLGSSEKSNTVISGSLADCRLNLMTSSDAKTNLNSASNGLPDMPNTSNFSFNRVNVVMKSPSNLDTNSNGGPTSSGVPTTTVPEVTKSDIVAPVVITESKKMDSKLMPMSTDSKLNLPAMPTIPPPERPRVSVPPPTSLPPPMKRNEGIVASANETQSDPTVGEASNTTEATDNKGENDSPPLTTQSSPPLGSPMSIG